MKKHGDHGKGKRHYICVLWQSIKTRCYNKKYHTYKYYGGRGVVMFEKWKNNYPLFKCWILSNLGERPKGHPMDRIDNNLGYFPENIRWANSSTQASNKRKKYQKRLYLK